MKEEFARIRHEKWKIENDLRFKKIRNAYLSVALIGLLILLGVLISAL